MKQILTRLVENETLSREETRQIMLDITQEKYTDVQITAFLTSLLMRGIQVDELLGLRDGLKETGKALDFSDFNTIDIVGTGGDNKNTFNISTCSGFVVAAAGYPVAKHGNYASTSTSGASNVLEALGVRFTDNEDQLRRNLATCGFTYLHAPLFAKGMKFVAPVRKAMQIPTCFNLLGPLVNPSNPKNQLLGVATLNQMRLYSNVNQQLGINYGIVNSMDGYDEISLTGTFKIKTPGMEQVFTPKDLGLPVIRPQEIYGGESVEEARDIFVSILKNESNESRKTVVLVNAAFAIKVMEPDLEMVDCMARAREALESGNAYQTLLRYIEQNS